jgi:mono/diheme cytochrome c family protein
MAVRITLIGIWAIYLLFFTISGPRRMQAGGMEDQEPKVLYKAKCASCHGIDGSANTAIGKNLKAKDLRSAETQKMSDEKLYQIIAEGRGKMPAFERSLGEDKCRQLVAYIRGMAKKE